jgi:hypothetical protein
MKSIILKIALLQLILNSAMASDLVKIDVFPPYLNVGCSDIKIDSAGKLGLQLNQLTALDSGENIQLLINQQIKVCQVSSNNLGEKQLAWKLVSPYKGFEVQYFDFKTSSIKFISEQIDLNKKFNRIEASLLLDDTKIINENLIELADETLSGKIIFNKNNLLNQNDLDQLNAGKEITKTVVLFNKLNTTTIVDSEVVELGDQVFSGRDIKITFRNFKNKIKLSKIEL